MPNEHRFFFGELDQPASPRPNLLHLTLNKAASQHVAKLLAALVADVGYRAIWPNRYAFFVDVPFVDQMDAAAIRANRNLLQPKGLLLAAIGQPVTLPEVLDATRQIVVVRDPRDLMTSNFYSLTQFHPEPTSSAKRAHFERRREEARRQGVDAFVLDRLPETRLMLEQYAAISRRPTCLATLRFEDFRDDYAGWIERLEHALGLAPDPDRRVRMAGFAPQPPATERVGNKIRSGRSGQFHEKLKPATVARLNDELQDVLEVFGYPLH
jgi:hypothetical protein